MHPLASELNAVLKGSVADALLSELGRRLFFPKGIVAQSAEAKKHATRANATVGIATSAGSRSSCRQSVPWCPGSNRTRSSRMHPPRAWKSFGRCGRRRSFARTRTSGPPPSPFRSSSPGLTCGISTLADLFVDKGDILILPDLHWDNYPLIFETRRQAVISAFPFYSSTGTFNVEGLRGAVKKASGAGRIALILNFPNNPTGYSLMKKEADEVVAVIKDAAESGTHCLVIMDDAYFGLFYEEGIYAQSLFARLCGLHENVLAAKVDGSTKEDLTWGFRTGFITLGARGLSPEQYDALTRKLMGAVRSTVSNSSVLAQNLILHAMESPDREPEKKEAGRLLRQRYERAREILSKKKSTAISPLPFNSGYFMSFRLHRGKAEDLRKALLMGDGVGTIAVDDTCLRVAFSSVDVEKLQELYDLIYAAAEKL